MGNCLFGLRKFEGRACAPRRALGLAGVAVALVLASAASAHDDECAAECRQEATDCHEEARAAMDQCLETFGCGELGASFREQCVATHREDRDADACAELGAELKECMAPCRVILRPQAMQCREIVSACMEDLCGVTASPGHRFGPRRHSEF